MRLNKYQIGKRFFVGGLALLILSGCSSSPTSKYDEVELLQYQACLSQVTTKAPSGFSGSMGNEIQGMLEWCNYLKPSPLS
jgi:hypothetical protein